VEPTIGGHYLLIQDQVLLNILKNNMWERAIYLSAGFGEDLPNYVKKYCRLDGLAWKLVPQAEERDDYGILEENVLHRLDFSGLGPTAYLDITGRKTAEMYKAPIAYLAECYKQDGRQPDLDSLSSRFEILRQTAEDSAAGFADD
jgi:hypothetical protein